MADELQPVGMVQPGGGLQPAGMTGGAAQEPGVLSRLWSGMLGQDVSKVGRVGMGMADPAVGMGQLAAHGNLGLPMSRPLPKGVPEAADRTVQEREAGYEQREKRAGLSGGLATEWARLLGNVASPVTMLAGGGASAAGKGAALIPRLGAYGAGGAATALVEPQTGKDAFDLPQIAKRAGFGALGGAVGGAAGDALGSGLGRAIAGNNPQAVDALTSRVYRQAIQPTRAGRKSAVALDLQDEQIKTVFNRIINHNQQTPLQLTDEAGRPVVGRLPSTLRQFSEATDQVKADIYRQYDAMKQEAGQAGAAVDLAPITQKLNKLAQSLVDVHPQLANEALGMSHRLQQQGIYTTAKAQETIENLNKVNGYPMRNPVHDLVTQELRSQLDKAITGAVGPGYQKLRDTYGALKSVEENVTAATQREANKRIPGGLSGLFMNTLGAHEIIRGIMHFRPEAVATGLAVKGAQKMREYLNSPNRAIEKLFSTLAQPPAGQVRGGIGAVLERGLPAAGTAAGGVEADRALRPSVGAY